MEGRKLRAVVGILAGGLFGALLFALLEMNTPGSTLIRLLAYPGLFAATATGASVFSSPLWLMVIANMGFWFGAGWLLGALWDTHFRQPKIE
jgi:hypothetical protein